MIGWALFGAAVSSRPAGHHQSAPAASQRPALHPRYHNPSAKGAVTRHHQRFTPLTVRSSLARGPRTEREPFVVSPELRTPPLPATHAEVGTGLTGMTSATPSTQSTLPTASSLNACDFVSHLPLYPRSGRGTHRLNDLSDRRLPLSQRPIPFHSGTTPRSEVAWLARHQQEFRIICLSSLASAAPGGAVTLGLSLELHTPGHPGTYQASTQPNASTHHVRPHVAPEPVPTPITIHIRRL
jgi:hypothetical protein